jgi:2'-5' RNA ligase
MFRVRRTQWANVSGLGKKIHREFHGEFRVRENTAPDSPRCMSPARLFVALVPPAAVRAELAILAPELAGLRATPAENIHLTLRFIGEADPEKTDRFVAALLRVRVEPFVLPVGGVGLFPSRGPAKVLWAGVGNGHTRLYQLRKQVDESLLTVDAGLPMPGFHPHFTVARLGEQPAPREIARFLAFHAGFEAPPFLVDEFLLLASEGAAGRPPVYRPVRRFALGS